MITNANLHIILSYDPLNSQLVAEFYNNNIPNSKLTNPFVITGEYIFYRENIPFFTTNTTVDRVIVPVLPGYFIYKVFAKYNANSIMQPDSEATIIVGSNYIYSKQFLIQTQVCSSDEETRENKINFVKSIFGGPKTNIYLVPFINFTAYNIKWMHNYKLFTPIDEHFIVAKENGIYEISFQCIENNYTYIGIIEIIDMLPIPYVKLLSLDGNTYGIFGAPISAATLFVIPVGTNAPYKCSNIINGKKISNDTYLTINNFNTGEMINFVVEDEKNTIMQADTMIL